MTGYETPRADVLITEARRAVGDALGSAGIGARALVDLVGRLADALEAATGGQHIESKHYAELGRLRNEVARLSQQSQSEPEYVTALRARVAELETELAETKAVDIEEYRHLLAVIERARKAPYHGIIAGGIRQDSVYTILDSIKTEGSF